MVNKGDLKAPASSEQEWRNSQNRVSRDDLRDSIDQYSREPFADLLSAMMAASPTQERLIKWAAERPGEWVNSIKVLALLSGFTEKTESVQTHRHLHLHKMSDAELLQATQIMIDNDPTLYKDLVEIDKNSNKLTKDNGLEGTGLEKE